jgi:hypothetical protein
MCRARTQALATSTNSCGAACSSSQQPEHYINAPPTSLRRPISNQGQELWLDKPEPVGYARHGLCKPQLRPNADTADIVVTAKLAYDRFKNYAARKDSVSIADYYRRLSALPHLDVFNGRPTFGYFTPVLRIVAREVGGAA